MAYEYHARMALAEEVDGRKGGLEAERLRYLPLFYGSIQGSAHQYRDGIENRDIADAPHDARLLQ